jgi:pyruvate, orthophosphate dikinase
MKWADKYRTLKVRTNADTPADAKRAREFGAEGIGLCRTEHMFFEGDRIKAMREMILAETEEARKRRWPSCCRSSARTSSASSPP